MKYTSKKIGPIGDHDPKYGQRYWGHVAEADMEVSFNLMNPKDIEEGMVLEFEEKSIRETRGSEEKPPREYLQLKKVRVIGTPTVTSAPKSNPDIAKKLDTIIGNQKLIMSWLRELAGKDEPSEEPQGDTVDTGFDPDSEVNIKDIPF